jgi:NAD(P)-dependent dehydrogenase (short-subunit alcohol dehydrogenase family)
MLGEITEDQFDSLFSLNSRGTLFTVQKALPMMRNGGSIIMNGSIAHLKGMPGLSVYAGSKAALRSFARSWAVELAERRIRVNVLSPGPIATNAMANLPAEAKEYFLSGIPRKEFGRSEEIAATALFLASDDSSFVNGSEICVDGGLAQI